MSNLQTSSSDGPNTPDQDALLVQRVQSGDKNAFGLLVQKYQHKVLSTVSRYVRDSHEAQDVTQETFIKAYRAIKNFRGDSAFYTWLHRIAVNTAKNHLVAKSRRLPTSDIDIQETETLGLIDHLKSEETPENHLFRDELADVIAVAVSELSEDLRMAIVLREIEEMSYEEIAQVMDCPVGTVRSRIFRARDAIDAKIKPLMEKNG